MFAASSRSLSPYRLEPPVPSAPSVQALVRSRRKAPEISTVTRHNVASDLDMPLSLNNNAMFDRYNITASRRHSQLADADL
jgi:hypothetical protein